MKIKICEKENEKMLENFNNEEYPDIVIQTTNSKISLVLAYLAIDSQFFGELDCSNSTVDLSHLPQQPLIQVLRSLYGDELTTGCVSELQELYLVINELKIEDYKKQIKTQILSKQELMENLQILEFCFNNDLICQEIKSYHFETNLKALQDNRKFLQLNKISLQTLIPLLLEYYQIGGDSTNATINNILENYFNRNNIRPAEFFQEEDIEILQNIWEQFHHTLQIMEKRVGKAKSFQVSNQLPFGYVGFKNKSHTIKQQNEIIALKDSKIQLLREEIEIKDGQINRLREQLYEIKRISFPKATRKMPSIPVLPVQDEEISILEGVKFSRKQQRNFGGIDNSINEQGFRDYKSSNRVPQNQKMHKF